MHSKMTPKWKLLFAPLVFFGLLTASPGPVDGAGARPGEKAAAPGPAVSRSSVRHGTPVFGFVNPYPHYYYPYPYRFSGYYAQPIVVISPVYYPYFIPPLVVASAPFYCLAHQMGWVSRAGMLDHLSGTHKISLETAASVCPEATGSCVMDGY